MKKIWKWIRRFTGILLLSSFLLLVLNIALVIIVTFDQTAGMSPWTTAVEAAEGLLKTEDGYRMTKEIGEELKRENIWAVFIDNDTHRVVWHTSNLPAEIPMEYSLSEVSLLSRGYVKDYPTFTGVAENGLMVLGYPKDRYWKQMYPSWDYSFIAHLLRNILFVLGCNIVLILLIYVAVNSRLFCSVKPLAEGIQALPSGNPIYVREKGLLSDLAAKVNQTADVLQYQKNQMKKKETARANWIAGVSHDIRTPLAMVMGYAGQLEEDSHLTDAEHRKVTAILRQSERMKNLVQDLNLASKLEYNMQPVKIHRENIVAIVRQVVVEFINSDVDNRYPVEWLAESALTDCMLNVDKDLLRRAVYNLMQNCMNHNEKGCTIYVSVEREQENSIIRVEDNGEGVSDEQIEKLNHTPHYLVCDEQIATQRHGLGLLIVRQIMTSHKGETVIGQSSYGGLSVKLMLPAEKKQS